MLEVGGRERSRKGRMIRRGGPRDGRGSWGKSMKLLSFPSHPSLKFIFLRVHFPLGFIFQIPALFLKSPRPCPLRRHSCLRPLAPSSHLMSPIFHAEVTKQDGLTDSSAPGAVPATPASPAPAPVAAPAPAPTGGFLSAAERLARRNAARAAAAAAAAGADKATGSGASPVAAGGAGGVSGTAPGTGAGASPVAGTGAELGAGAGAAEAAGAPANAGAGAGGGEGTAVVPDRP